MGSEGTDVVFMVYIHNTLEEQFFPIKYDLVINSIGFTSVAD